MKRALTARKVETAAPHKTRREIPDAYLPGLYLIIQSGGAKSWAVRYRRQDERTRKHTLGPYPRLSLKAARELGAEALRTVAEGRDPAQEKREARTAEPNDIESVLKDFLQKHTRKKNGDPVRETTRRERARLFGLKRDPNGEWIKTGNGVLKRWKGRAIDSITKNDVRDLISDVPGKVLPNRTLDVLKTFFTWCVKQDRLSKSPCDKIEPPCPKTSGERVLSTDELRMVWRAAQTMGPPFGSLVQLLMLTGQRRNEVANMEWQELDIENQL